jgi:hypothetical protein
MAMTHRRSVSYAPPDARDELTDFRTGVGLVSLPDRRRRMKPKTAPDTNHGGRIRDAQHTNPFSFQPVRQGV